MEPVISCEKWLFPEFRQLCLVGPAALSGSLGGGIGVDLPGDVFHCLPFALF